MYIEIDEKEALARSMMIALARERGLPDDLGESVKALWCLYQVARGNLDIIERDWNADIRAALQKLEKPTSRRRAKGTAKGGTPPPGA